jgi:hypothetical protein
MAASYESVRRDRRYLVDASGVTEFGPDRDLRQFIPWCVVTRIAYAHDRRHKQLRWSVRATDGSKITPQLEYANALESYDAVVRAWRAFAPHACRAHFARVYRRSLWAMALLHLTWAIPALLIYTLLGLSYALHRQIPWEAVGPLSNCSTVLYAMCVVTNLLLLKALGPDFDRWYARLQSRLTEPMIAPPVSSSVIVRWLCPAPGTFADEPITDEERILYTRWETHSALPLVVLVALLTSAWYLGLTWAASLFRPEAPGTRFLIQPSASYWLIPAIFLGMITSPILLYGLYRGLLRDRYRRFERCCVERDGFDVRRLLVCLAVVIFTGSAVCFLAGVTSFSRFNDTGNEIQRPLSFRSSFYEYTRVRTIERRATIRAPIGNEVPSPRHVILFDDGTLWSSRELLRIPVPEVDGQIAQLVSERSRRPIIEQP